MRLLIIVAAVGILGACASERYMLGATAKSPGSIAERVTSPTEKQLEDFGSLAGFVGMTMTGSPTAESDEQFTDVQTWEWALGGKAILIRHALEDGSYGGDTYVYKDAKSEKLTYVYITNAGFHTVGEMVPTEKGWIAEEAVTGHPEITRVRSTSVVHEDKSTSMTSEYLKAGEWVAGHAFEYEATNDPLPALKSE